MKKSLIYVLLIKLYKKIILPSLLFLTGHLTTIFDDFAPLFFYIYNYYIYDPSVHIYFFFKSLYLKRDEILERICQIISILFVIYFAYLLYTIDGGAGL